MSDQKDNQKSSSFGRVHRRRRREERPPKPWWQMSRRTFIIGGAGAVLAGAGLVYVATRDDSTDVDKDSLELQRAQGWNVGSEDRRLVFPQTQSRDSQGAEGWKKYLDQPAMLAAYRPKSPEWMPFFVPTLIQSLQYGTLRGQLVPVFTPDMQASYERGQTIARDFIANSQNAGATAFIVDIPGRESVAFGAGMAEQGRTITTFDNFPHPLGVAPSHETLAAMLYYAGEIEAKQAKVSGAAPPVFLLDSRRLTPYVDEDVQFDNRYLAALPSASKLRERGIQSIVYITPDRSRREELDDLNEEFVDYKKQGLNVAMLPLSDLVPVREVAGQPGAPQTVGERHYYYGGHRSSHFFFFHSYPHFIPVPGYVVRDPVPSPANRGRVPLTAPARPISAPKYEPVSRPTMFSSSRIGGRPAGVGRTKPSGFGRTTARVSPEGRVVGVRPGRSGAFASGRSRSSSGWFRSSRGRSGSLGRGGRFSG
jgi:hypothetical protein